jgi:hypothetical protein
MDRLGAAGAMAWRAAEREKSEIALASVAQPRENVGD